MDPRPENLGHLKHTRRAARAPALRRPGARPGRGPDAARLRRARDARGRVTSGTGTTIAVIVPYVSPWVAHDLDVYSRRYGLPPARLTIIRYGHVPAAAAHGAVGQHWAREGTEDLEMAHALAPGAALTYVEVPDLPPGDV